MYSIDRFFDRFIKGRKYYGRKDHGIGSSDGELRCGRRAGDPVYSIHAGLPEDVLEQALRYKSYWRQNGGITVSGGEALLQMEFVTRLFELAKEKGVNTCLDTSGGPYTTEEPFFSKFEKLAAVTDLFLLDIKQIDEEKHKSLTGFTNQNVLQMAQYLSDHDRHMWIRHVLVPGITTDEGDLQKLADFIKTLKTVDRVEVLPYHSLGVPKYEKMGIKYTLDGVTAPSDEQIARAKEILGITV